ncbi:hypothetical protein [Kribbella sandramycini]|uniref:Uncharacterized protein n=1 Tax=Kribbella sandramycini TaxID=60450 RepID=A0A841SDX6_9ACTN|nr:hypothetical protein [Kribbella sandramycini]MBB6570198.1 hypothetical protein [Kribbella sandramycini]
MGSVVQRVRWRSIPDKYVAPRVLETRAEALEFSEQHLVWLEYLMEFPEGEAALGTPKGEWDQPDPVPGDQVVQVSTWFDDTSYSDPAAVVAAAPAGVITEVQQILWIGPQRVEVYNRHSVDKT